MQTSMFLYGLLQEPYKNMYVCMDWPYNQVSGCLLWRTVRADVCTMSFCICASCSCTVHCPAFFLKHTATLQMESVSASLLFGWPHILVPHADSFDSMTEMKANEQSLLALCQVHPLCIYAQLIAHPA